MAPLSRQPGHVFGEQLALLAKRGGFSEGQLAELEDQLMCAYEQAREWGSSSADARLATLGSLGALDALVTEYRKENLMKPLSRLAGIAMAPGIIVLMALALGESLGSFIDLPSLLLVCGVVFGGLFASHGPHAMLRCLRQALEQEPMAQRDVAASLRVARNGYRLCWAAGTVGVLLGVVHMLSNLSDPSLIGAGIAVSILSLLYGALLAELVFANIVQWLRTGEALAA